MKTTRPLLWGLAVAATLGSSLSLLAADEAQPKIKRTAAETQIAKAKVRAKTQALKRQLDETDVLPAEDEAAADPTPSTTAKPKTNGRTPGSASRGANGSELPIPGDPMREQTQDRLASPPAPLNHGPMDGGYEEGSTGYDDGGYGGGCASGNCAGGSCGCGDSCGGYCGQCCDCICGPPGKYWIREDYLFWWTRGMNTPPLLTTSPPGTTTGVGVLGQPGTRVLFGGDELNDDGKSGGRISGGMWLDECMQCAIEADYLSLGEQDDDFSISSGGNPLLARPFIDISTGTPVPSSQLVAQPGLIDGSFTADVDTEFQSGGINYRSNWLCENFCQPSMLQTLLGCCCPGKAPACARIDFIAGYRFYRLDDRIQMREDLISRDPGGFVQIGTRFQIDDDFDTSNEFHGAEIGFVEDIHRGPWSLGLTAKLALGNNNQRVRINGSTVITPPNQAGATSAGGLLAQPTNIGTYERSDFTAIPNLGMNIGYQWTCHLRSYVGYTLIYWNDVARAGDQIDTTVNTSQLPPGTLVGAARPAFQFEDTHFWAHGINAGLEFRF